MKFYIDASALVALYVAEPRSDPVMRILLSETAELVVSDFAAGEFGAAISKAVRMQRLSVSAANRNLADFDIWRKDDVNALETAPINISDAADFVRRFELNLRLPDAIHIAICRQHELHLITLDLGQAAAAEALGISVTIPE